MLSTARRGLDGGSCCNTQRGGGVDIVPTHTQVFRVPRCRSPDGQLLFAWPTVGVRVCVRVCVGLAVQQDGCGIGLHRTARSNSLDSMVGGAVSSVRALVPDHVEVWRCFLFLLLCMFLIAAWLGWQHPLSPSAQPALTSNSSNAAIQSGSGHNTHSSLFVWLCQDFCWR